MTKKVIVYGSLSGLIIATLMTISTAIYTSSGNFENGMLYGYASMIIAFSLIFVGIKNVRDKDNNGIISFGKAFKIGLFITLIASTIYVVTWLVNYYYFLPDFLEKYTAHVLEKLKSSGASTEEIAKQTKEMVSFAELYKNPFFNALMTYAEILPVGLIVTLISSIILKKKAIPDSLK